MPPQIGYDQAQQIPDQPAAIQDPTVPSALPSRVSRRSLLRVGAGAGAVGIAAAVGAGGAVELLRPKAEPTLMPTAKPVAVVAMPPAAMAGPLVVYISDTTTGLFDVFGDAGQTRVKNPALVSQLLKNLQMAQ
jgi:hypothetical protein